MSEEITRNGLLWFDNDPVKSLSEKIITAAGYYTKKYGLPDLAKVHPSALEYSDIPPNDILVYEGHIIKVEGYRPVLSGHLWLGQLAIICAYCGSNDLPADAENCQHCLGSTIDVATEYPEV